MDNKVKANLHEILDNQIDLYKDNDYMTSRLIIFIENLFPTSLINAKKNHDNKLKEKVTEELQCNTFAERFINGNSYYYLSYPSLFIKYNGINYYIYNEDEILYQILSTITNKPELRSNKHKIKNWTLKKLKEHSPFISIPESTTIQNVINYIYPRFFSSRNAAKYFLTIIGDCILKKNENIIFIANNSIKMLIKELNHIAYTFLGVSNLLSCIKFKYHDHDYDKCRFICSNKSIEPIHLPENLNILQLDIIVVAVHYSNRFSNSDYFIEQCDETDFTEHATFLKNNSLDDIVNLFCKNTLVLSKDSFITTKNIHFLWKKFLNDIGMPNIVFYNTLNQVLKTKIDYCKEKDEYKNITSPHLPFVSNFMSFWELNMECDDDNELEIGEINKLFSEWNGKGNKMLKISGDPEIILIDLIKHFFPNVIIEDNKYIMGFKCKLWNKYIDVVNAIEIFKLQLNLQNVNAIKESSNVTINQIYENYSKNKKRIVSKRYFEKVAIDILTNKIDDDGFINWN